MRNDPAAIRWLVGTELMRLRQEAGLSITHVAKQCGVSKTTLSHKEIGRSPQSPEDLETLAASIGCETELPRLRRLASVSDSRTWWAPWEHVVPQWLRLVLGLEGIAKKVFLYEPLIIPGIAQTIEYTRALTQASDFIRPDHYQPIIDLRQARARRLTEEPLLEFHIVVEQDVLHRTVGDRSVMLEQLKHLAQLASLDNVTLQILRPEDGPHAAVTAGSFEIMEFTDASPVAYVELFDNALYLREKRHLQTYQLFAESVADTGLESAKSLDNLRAILKTKEGEIP